MEPCKHDVGGKCQKAAAQHIHLPTGRWCRVYCRPNDDAAAEAMLQRLRERHPGTEKAQAKKDGCPSCGKLKNIIKGWGKLVVLRVLGEKPPDWAIERSEICAACELHTFLDVVKYGLGVVKRKTPLPIDNEPGPWKGLYCSQCKCYIEAKILVKGEKCPLHKW